MKPNTHLTTFANRLLLIALALMIVYMFIAPAQVRAKDAENALPSLEEFIEEVENGEAGILRGAYIPEVLALPVVRQPQEDARYVSPRGSILTQFNLADRAGNIGLLAHNYLAGRLFVEVVEGNLIILIYGDGRTEIFTVENIYQYEALPDGMYKNIGTQSVLDIGELFNAMYGGKRHVTLQTCIAKDSDSSWGRLFITARALGGGNAQIVTSLTPAPPPPPIKSVWSLKTLFKLSNNADDDK